MIEVRFFLFKGNKKKYTYYETDNTKYKNIGKEYLYDD